MFWDENDNWTYRLDSREKTDGYASRVREIDRGIGAFLEFDPHRLGGAEKSSGAENTPVSEDGGLRGLPIADRGA
ncbi:MAG: hypothetical protein ACP5IA_05030, partial [Sediminispirochaetaceae bacterium]